MRKNTQTPKYCLRGHDLGEKYILSVNKKKCRLCFQIIHQREYQREYKRDRRQILAFRQHAKKIQDIWYMRNREKRLASALRYYYEHKEKIAEKNRQKYQEQKQLGFDLFFFVHRSLPEWWNPDMRDDIRQAMLVDILDGTLSLLGLYQARLHYVRAFFRKNLSYRLRSYDAPIFDGSKITFADVLASQSTSTA